MTTMTPNAQDIARFLQEQPSFFEEHAEIFASLHVPNPHGGRAISLAERQIQTLRERVHGLEWKLNELAHNASTNEKISQQVARWTQTLLGTVQAADLPTAISGGLAAEFGLEHAALRLWNLPGLPADSDALSESADARAFADSLQTPYCGHETGFEAVRWLGGTPKSLALVALRLQPQAPSIGLLILGSEDATRFSPEKGTAFLDAIGRLASAALQRLAAA